MLPMDITALGDEVKSGQVYGVVQLYKVLGDKPALEKKPRDVFARTYLTIPIYHGHRYRNRMAVLALLTGDLRNDQSLIDKARRIIGGEDDCSARRSPSGQRAPHRRLRWCLPAPGTVADGVPDAVAGGTAKYIKE